MIIIGVSIFLIFFHTKTAKNLKIGNNSTSQEIIDYVLNISSYEATIEVEVNSNKNQNQYILKQQYIAPDMSIQEILEPSNIAGVKIVRNGNQLTIENTNLSLTSIFENYEYVSDNILDLSCFIEDYKMDSNSSWNEENNQIVMKTKKDKEEKVLWIDRTTGNPTKLEIKWTNKKNTVYISYNEVSLNSLK
jgi:outer membrane lipoprotein-sorting protein